MFLFIVPVIKVSLQYSQEWEPEKENYKYYRDQGRGEGVGNQIYRHRETKDEPESSTSGVHRPLTVNVKLQT